MLFQDSLTIEIARIIGLTIEDVLGEGLRPYMVINHIHRLGQ